MAITAAQLIARVSVEGASAAQGQLLGVGSAADATEARFRSLAVMGSGVLVAGLIAVAAVSVKMAADFQQAVNRLRTGAGDTQDSFATLASGILKVSTATGLMSGPLTKAMYEILSSGQRGAQAFETLSAAAKGAVIEQANVVDVSDTLAGAMTNFGTRTFGAVAYMNGLITAVSRGRITLQDLSTAMGPIEPVAHAMGISFSDLAAAMSTQTNAAIPAARAATGLRFMMQSLEVPTTKAKDAMAAMGLSSMAVANEMKVSLPGALQMVYNAAKKAGPEGSVPFNQAVSDMVGGQRALATFLALTGSHMKDFSGNAKAIAASMRTGTGDVNGWAIAQTNFNVILDRAKAAIGAAAIGLGLLLLPALGRIVGIIPQIVDYFSNFSQHANVLIPILAGVATVIAGLLVPAVIALAVGVIAATWPVLAIGAAVAALVAIFMHFYSTNAGFKAFIDTVVTGFRVLWSLIQANFIPTLQRLAAFFQGTILPALAAVGTFLIGTFKPAWDSLVAAWNTNVLPALKMLWGLIQQLAPVLKIIGVVILASVLLPLALMAAAFVLVVKGVALLLQGLGGLIGFVGATFSAIGATITNFKNMVGAVFSAIGATFNNFGKLVGSVFSTIGSLFPWLYNHNTYIKALVDLAVTSFNTFKANAGGVFSAIGTVVNTFRNVMGSVFSAVGATLNTFRNLVGSIFSWIGSTIGGSMNSATGSVQSFGSNALGAIGSFVGGAMSAIGGLVSRIAGYLGGLAGQAFQWGANLLGSFASGIWSAIGGVVDAAQSAMSQVAGILGFHSPAKAGPGRDADTWAPNLMKMFTQGIVAGTPQVQSALAAVLSPLAANLSVTASHSSSTPTFAAGASLSRSIGSLGRSGGSAAAQQPIHVNVYLDGAPVAKKLMPHIATAIRQATGAKF